MNLIKKRFPAQTKRIEMTNKQRKGKMMENTLNYRDLAYQSMNGLNYDELLELQTETGFSIEYLEHMFYNLKN